MSRTAKNANLQSAKKGKNDEFYTRFADIENECCRYEQHFRGKTVLCNCDDPRVSNFFRYFFINFYKLGLTRLIATCCKKPSTDLSCRNKYGQAVYCIYDGTVTDYEFTGIDEFIKQNEWTTLKGDGDFRSGECIELLKQADIICTNPPFSLFREYTAQLIEYDKKFLIIGNMNALSYKEIFPLIKENKLWTGINNKSTLYIVPKEYDGAFQDKNGIWVKKMGNTCWFTNLDHKQRHEELRLCRSYTPEKYPKYDNYNAVEVSKTSEIPIPETYDGVMGIPVSFLEKYNPDQFEIVGADYDVKLGLLPELVNPKWKGKLDRGYLNGERLYARLLIRHKKSRLPNLENFGK
ncbi:putative adenine-specific methylase [Planctomycetales bacterium]|nr:putative adenine-specific methylase [Planctomycetales bacterium]